MAAVFAQLELDLIRERTKAGLRSAYLRLLKLDFDVLLLAHGEPVTSGGSRALRAFLDDAR